MEVMRRYRAAYVKIVTVCWLLGYGGSQSYGSGGGYAGSGYGTGGYSDGQ